MHNYIYVCMYICMYVCIQEHCDKYKNQTNLVHNEITVIM